MDEATKLPIGPEEVAEAAQILQRYKAGKAALDKRLVDNELWFGWDTGRTTRTL